MSDIWAGTFGDGPPPGFLNCNRNAYNIDTTTCAVGARNVRIRLKDGRSLPDKCSPFSDGSAPGDPIAPPPPAAFPPPPALQCMPEGGDPCGLPEVAPCTAPGPIGGVPCCEGTEAVLIGTAYMCVAVGGDEPPPPPPVASPPPPAASPPPPPPPPQGQAESWAAFAARSGCTASSDCVVPAGDSVVIDSDADVASLTVRGSLTWSADRENLRLSAGFVCAEGAGSIVVGTPASPAPEGTTIYLKDNGREHPKLKTRSFGNEGPDSLLHVEGRPLARTWALMVRTAFAGDSSIEVDGDLAADGWRVGDAIAIAFMGQRAQDADRRTITALSPGGGGSTVLGLSAPLAATRLGRPDRRLQSEVLNLSRGVTITGDPISNGVGLHTIGFHAKHHMIHYARVENCGQLGVAGKYCLHFHHAEDCPNCSFVGNAVERGEQRGIIIHGTHNSLTERNVLFDLKGSYIYIEDGNEMQNTIRQNVALCPRKESCRQSGTDNGLADQNHQSGIWALSVSNDFIGAVFDFSRSSIGRSGAPPAD